MEDIPMTQQKTIDETPRDDDGPKPLDSRVEGSRIYGEPKGPLPGSLYEKEGHGVRPPDRNRDGFVAGVQAVGKGDEVGSGPEETDRLPEGAQANDSPPMSYPQAEIDSPDPLPVSPKSKT